MFFPPIFDPTIIACTAAGSVAPPAITVSVSGLVATITNTGGPITSLSSTNGSQTGPLEWTFTAAGAYVLTATGPGGSSTAYAFVGLAVVGWASPSTCATSLSPYTACSPGDGVRFLFNAATGSWDEQPASGYRPIFRQDAGGKYYLESDGVGTNMKLSGGLAASAILVNDFVMGFAGRFTANIDFQMMFGNNLRTDLLLVSSLLTPGVISTPTLASPNAINLGSDYRIVATGATATQEIFVNGILENTGTATPGPVAMLGNLNLISREGPSYVMQGRAYAWGIYPKSANWSAAQFDAWLQGYVP